MSRFKSLKAVFDQWGGSTATFFTYTHLSHDSLTGLLPALLPLIRASLGLNYLQSGLLLSAYSITSGLSQFLGGWLSDRLSRHKVMAIGMGGISLLALTLGLNPVYQLMLANLVIMGIFAGGYHPSGTSLLFSHVDVAKRGKAMAVHMVGGSIGFAIGPLIGGFIGERLGWRAAYVILSLPVMLAVPFILRWFRQRRDRNDGTRAGEAPTDSKMVSQTEERRIGIGQVLRPLALIGTLTVLTHFVSGAAMAFLPIYLVDKHGIAPAFSVTLMGIMRSGGIAGSLVGGWLSDKWGRERTVYLGLVASGLVLYLLTLFSYNAVLIVILILFGMVSLMRQATFQPYLMDNVPSHLRATIFGLYFGLSMEGVSLIQPFAGGLMDIYGIVEVFNFSAIIAILLSAGTFIVMLPKLRRA